MTADEKRRTLLSLCAGVKKAHEAGLRRLSIILPPGGIEAVEEALGETGVARAQWREFGLDGEFIAWGENPIIEPGSALVMDRNPAPLLAWIKPTETFREWMAPRMEDPKR